MQRLKERKEREKEQIKKSGKGEGSGSSTSDEFSGEGIPDDLEGDYKMTDRDKPELHEMMESAPPDIRRKFEDDG